MSINPKLLTDTTALSPFIKGTNVQVAWDSTSLSYLKTCPRLYQYIMIEGWAEEDESIHLYFGREYHSALQDYEIAKAQGESHENALDHALEELLVRTYGWEADTTTKAGKYKNRTSLIRSVIWYLEKFKDDAAKTVILENGKPAVELSFRFELGFAPHADSRHPYLLCGHLDKVVDFNGALFVVDHKTTTTTLSDYFFDQFDPNNQMTLYTVASQIVMKSPVRGVIINGVQLLMSESKFERRFTLRTRDQLDEWMLGLEYWLTLAEHFATSGFWPMNDTACDKFGGCKFRSVCSKSPLVRTQALKAKFKQLDEASRWNPLRAR